MTSTELVLMFQTFNQNERTKLDCELQHQWDTVQCLVEKVPLPKASQEASLRMILDSLSRIKDEHRMAKNRALTEIELIANLEREMVANVHETESQMKDLEMEMALNKVLEMHETELKKIDREYRKSEKGDQKYRDIQKVLRSLTKNVTSIVKL